MELTPKEYAKILIQRFGYAVRYEGTENKDAFITNINFAKECSIVSVKESMKFIGGDLNEAFDKTLYLTETLEEIEKL